MNQPVTMAESLNAPIDFDAEPVAAAPTEAAAATVDDFDAAEEAAAAAAPEKDAEEPAEEKAPEPDADEDDETDPDVSEAARKLAEAKRNKKNPQARIAQLTAKLRQAERERDEARAAQAAKPADKAESEAGPAKTDKAETSATDYPDDPADPSPKFEDFDTYEQFVRAEARWVVRQETKAEKAAAQARVEREQADRAANEALAQHAQRVESFKAQHADFDDAINNPEAVVTEFMLREIVESEQGAAIAYFLGNNPEESRRIASLSPAAQVKAIGKLEARLEAASPASAPAVPPTTKAPKPMPRVGGGVARSTVADDDLDHDAWISKRNAEDAKRRSGR